MAGTSDIRAGRAFVELFLKNSLAKGLGQARKQLQDFGKNSMKMGSDLMRLGGMVTAAGATMAAAFIAPIKAAGDLMETMSKFGAVFGDQAPAMEAWMKQFAEGVGRGKQELADSASAFGAFFQGLDMGREKAAALAKQMTELAVDFGSFHNMQDTEAMQRFISALSGSGEVLSMYGVNIMEAALNQKLLAMGFPTIAKGATEVQKVMARMSIIKESMGRQGAVGDAVKTAGSFSNQLKRLKGSLADTAASIGNALLPVVTPLVTKASELVKLFAEWAKNNEEVIRTVAKLAVGLTLAGMAITGIGGALMFAGGSLAGMAVTAGILAGALKLVLSPLGLITIALVGGVYAWTQWTDSGKAAVAAVGAGLTRVAEIATKAWSGISDALMAGDLPLAGKVVMAALNLAFAEGWSKIADTLGQAMGTIATMVMSGDLAAAWDTAILTMSTTWDHFTTGIVEAFRQAVLVVEQMWSKTTAFVSASLTGVRAVLEATGGSGGKAASLALGAMAPNLNAAGSGVSDMLGSTATAAGAVRDSIASRAAGKERELKARAGAAGTANSLAVDAARKELDDLTSQAAKARAASAEKAKQVDVAAEAAGDTIAGKSGKAFGSFSAAALVASSGRGNIPQQQLAVAKEQVKIQKETLKKDEAMVKALEKGSLLQVAGA